MKMDLRFVLLIMFCSCRSFEPLPSISKVMDLSQYWQPRSYPASKVPYFFQQLLHNHQNAFAYLDSVEYAEFRQKYHLLADSDNERKYFQLKILHLMMTSHSAQNGSMGDILRIPYYWHWIQPNPRYEIRLIQDSSLLVKHPAPPQFSKYKSYADVDRSPTFFLTDLFAPQEKYFVPKLGSFASFGWCSEREMAFALLLDLLGYNIKVVAVNNHSWSQVLVPMNASTGVLNFDVSIDNTFDQWTWKLMTHADLEQWPKSLGNSPKASWYNAQAHAPQELRQIGQMEMSQVAMQRIEASLCRYLKRQLE